MGGTRHDDNPGCDPEAPPGAQPHPSDEPPIPDAEELPGTPRPAEDRNNKGAPDRPARP